MALTLLEASQALLVGQADTFPSGASARVQFAAGDWQNFVRTVRAAEGTSVADRLAQADANQTASDLAAQAHAASVAAKSARQAADDADASAKAQEMRAEALKKQADDAAAAALKVAKPAPLKPSPAPLTPAPLTPVPLKPLT
jgi:hypothetical protein